MIRQGELPENRKYLRLYLTGVRDGLIEDLGPAEADLSAAQKLLVDRVVNKLGILRCIEEQVKEEGVFRNGRLYPVLNESYLAYANSLRLDLAALGINRKPSAGVVDLGKYIERKVRTRRRVRPAQDIGQAEIVKPGPTSSDFQGAGGPGAAPAAGQGEGEIVAPGGSAALLSCPEDEAGR